MKQVIAPVLSNREIVSCMFLLRAEAPEIAVLVKPGQYIMVRCGEGSELVLRRPLSVRRTSDGKIDLLFAVVGQGTDWLSRRTKGDTLDILGPLGKGFEIKAKSLLLVAGGMGIAPLVALTEEALASGCKVTLLIGGSTGAMIYPQHLLPKRVQVAVTTQDGSLGRKGMVTDLLPEFIPEADQIFACGPLPMYKAMAKISDIFDQKPVQVLLETVLGCGVGACLGCTIETRRGQKRVCQDGPVFEMRDVVWEKMR